MMIGRLILLFTLLLSSLAWAQGSVTDGVLINADKMDRDMDKRTVRLEGNVQIVFQGQHLSCNKALIDLKNQKIVAEGNVILTSDKVHVEGDRVDFNYKKNTGLIYNGFMQSGQVVFTGSVIEKVDNNRYLATDGNFTACETCPPGWSFSGRKIDAELGGYARIRRPVFRVGGIPILILPSIIVPLKSARQSGFLVPVPEVSRRGGVGIGQSYFWAINRSQDATFTPKWFDKRGLKTDVEYRYMVSENGKGQLRASWTEDRAFQRSLQKHGVDSYHDRWYSNYVHYYDMPEKYVQRADLNLVSDLRLPRDFPKEMKGHGDPALENKVSITKYGDDNYGSAEADFYTNLLKTYPLASNDDAVNRAPELRYSFKETQLFDSGPFFKFDANYVNFVREKHNYDDLSGTATALGTHGEVARDGVYNSNTDKFRTGQRVDLKPALSMPFQIGRKLDVNPSVLYRETQYRFYPTDSAEQSDFSSTAARRYLQTELAVKTEFWGVFGDLADPKSNRWKHSFSPEVKYSQIPWSRRPDHPFFGEYEGLQYSRQYEPITDTEVFNKNSGLQFDYEDRTYARRVMDFSITNRFTRKTWLNDNPDYKTAVLFTVGQSYDFKEAESTTPHPWSSIYSLLDARFQHFETVTTMAYNGYAKVSNVSTRVRGMINPQNYLQVAYSRNYTFTDNYDATNEVRNIGFGGGFISPWVDAEAQVDFLARTFEVHAWKYRLNLKPPGKCWVIRFEHQLVVGSDDPSYKFSMAFDFGGEGKSTFN